MDINYVDKLGLTTIVDNVKKYVNDKLPEIESISDEDIEDLFKKWNIFSGTTNSNNEFTVKINGVDISIQPVDCKFEYKTKDDITTCNNMFYKLGGSQFTSLNLSDWDVSNVTSMQGIFYECRKLTSLDVSGWNVNNVTTMSNMFKWCLSVTSLDLHSWDVSNVTNMQSMFDGCKYLQSLDLHSWDVSSVTDMEYIFYNCYKLTLLDLTGWDVSSVNKKDYMFGNCGQLSTIKCSTAFKNWCLSNQTVIKLPNTMIYYGTWELTD